MVRHEFIGDGYRNHRAIYSDGSVVEIDLDSREYKIYDLKYALRNDRRAPGLCVAWK